MHFKDSIQNLKSLKKHIIWIHEAVNQYRSFLLPRGLATTALRRCGNICWYAGVPQLSVLIHVSYLQNELGLQAMLQFMARKCAD